MRSRLCRKGIVQDLKSYPSKISINMLAELTGRDRRTIAERLANLSPIETGSHGNLYDIRAAIRMIFDFNPDDEDQKVDFESEDFQPSHEKSKLDFVKRQAIELELAARKRELISRDEIQQALSDLFSNLKAKLRSVPARAAQIIQGPPPKQTEDILMRMVDEALTELSEATIE